VLRHWCRASTHNDRQLASFCAFAFFVDHLEVFVLATELHVFVAFTTFFTFSALDLATAISAGFGGASSFEQGLDDVVHFFSFGGVEILQELRDLGVFRVISACRWDRSVIHRRPQAFRLFPGSPFRAMVLLVMTVMAVLLVAVMAVLFVTVMFEASAAAVAAAVATAVTAAVTAEVMFVFVVAAVVLEVVLEPEVVFVLVAIFVMTAMVFHVMTAVVFHVMATMFLVSVVVTAVSAPFHAVLVGAALLAGTTLV
jgi:hypothetical protein